MGIVAEVHRIRNRYKVSRTAVPGDRRGGDTMRLTELNVPDLKAMAEGRRVAEMARELQVLKRRTSLLGATLRVLVEDKKTALGRMIFWRWVAVLECIGLLSLIALYIFS